MAKKQVTLLLTNIKYSGDNLGDDLQFHITIEGQTIHIERKIKHKTTTSIKKILSRKEVDSNILLPIHVQVKEKDPLYDDIGAGSTHFQIIADGSQIQPHSLQIEVTGDSIGDREKTAVFTLEFEAELKEIGIKFVKSISKRGWLTIKHEDNLTYPKVLPYALKVQVTEVKDGREYFTILEGRLKGHSASVRLSDNGASFLTEEDLHTTPVHLIYSKTNEILQIEGTNKAYWAILERSNPLNNGVYDLEIPYEPHHRYGAYYEKYSIFAKTWFRIGHSGDRFLHFGSVSEGCLTVKVQEVHKDRWNEIYNFLIRSRKGDSLSVGTLEIVD